MPPELTAVLAALAVGASPGEFAAVESLLGGSFSGLAEIRRNPVATIDAAGLTSQEISDWLSRLPIGQHAALQVAWIADRLGARLSLETLASNLGDLWFPAMDDVVCVLHSGGNLAVLVLDHEELITFSSVNPPAAEGDHPEMSDTPLPDRQVRLLMIVAEGGGDWDARRIDLTAGARFGPGDGTVLQELQALQRLGLVVRDDSRSGVGGRWKVTAAARPYLQ
jgi:hypothetical protein